MPHTTVPRGDFDKFNVNSAPEYERIFSPFTLGSLKLGSRVVRSATEMFIALPDGGVNPDETEIIGRFAGEPLGMIISGHTCVSAEGRSNMTQNGIWDDGFIGGQTALASAMKEGGTRAVMQIGHGGVTASGSNGGLPVLTQDNMTRAQIKELVRAFGAAAYRAKLCGYEGVQLHGAHYYLLSRWFYPHLNHRTDEYGGGAEGRFRLFREIFYEVKRTCGDGFPVLLKLNCTAPDDYDADGVRSYYGDVAAAVRLAGECGFTAVELSGHSANPAGCPEKPYFIDVARRLLSETDTPLILVGGVRSLDDMETALSLGVSAVSMCRPFLRTPDLLSRLLRGGETVCASCNGCFRSYDKNAKTRCLPGIKG